MAATDRRYDHNTGIITMPEMPDDKWVAGVIAIMLDEDGNYSAVFQSGEREMPTPEIREEIGSLACHAWEVANCPGLEL
ncbi:MAG TPA: hypothetical protein VKY39_01995 [Aggregatilineales bacterium]|nr:hypothetical protein [Aggregatilineales bacterium]